MPNAAVTFHRLAVRDYLTALRWYARRSAKAAQGFRAAVDQVVLNMVRAPQGGTIHHGRFRWMRVRRYPYVIYDEVIDPALVRILAVAHGRRRPGYWQRRTRP